MDDDVRELVGLKTFHERLRWAREYRGHTQEQLAAMVGLGKRQIIRLEKSNRTTDATKARLASALNVNETWLVSGVGNPFVLPAVQEYLRTRGKGLPEDSKERLRHWSVAHFGTFSPEGEDIQRALILIDLLHQQTRNRGGDNQDR